MILIDSRMVNVKLIKTWLVNEENDEFTIVWDIVNDGKLQTHSARTDSKELAQTLYERND